MKDFDRMQGNPKQTHQTHALPSLPTIAPQALPRGGDQDEEQMTVVWESGELGVSPGSAIVCAILLLRWASVFSLFDGGYIDPITLPSGVKLRKSLFLKTF